MPDSNQDHLDSLFNETEWCSLQDLKDYDINYTNDGWYTFPETNRWMYIVKDIDEEDGDAAYMLCTWNFDPRLYLAKIAGAEVR